MMESAGLERFDDSWHLLGAPDRALAYVYLCGYVVELCLKCAILTLAGVPRQGDAYGQCRALPVRSVKNHDLPQLASVLIQRRARLPANPVLDGQIRDYANLAAAEWSEELRYRAGVANEGDALRMIEIADWFVQNRMRARL